MLATALLAACAASLAVEPKPPEAEASIAAMDKTFVAAANAGDVDGVVAMYDANAVLMPPNFVAQRGIAAIRTYWGGFLKQGRVKLSLATEDVTQSCDLASERGTFEVTVTLPNGAPIHDKGKYVVTWRRMDSQWKAISDIFNSDLPAVPLRR